MTIDLGVEGVGHLGYHRHRPVNTRYFSDPDFYDDEPDYEPDEYPEEEY